MGNSVTQIQSCYTLYCDDWFCNSCICDLFWG